MVRLGEADLVGISIAWLVTGEFIGMLFDTSLAVDMTSIGVPDELQAAPAKMIARDRKIKAPRIFDLIGIKCSDGVIN